MFTIPSHGSPSTLVFQGMTQRSAEFSQRVTPSWRVDFYPATGMTGMG